MKTRIVDGKLTTVADAPPQMSNKEGLAKGVFVKSKNTTVDLRKTVERMKQHFSELFAGQPKIIPHKGVQVQLKPEFREGIPKQKAMAKLRTAGAYHSEQPNGKLLINP